MDELLIILVRGIGAGSIFALLGMSFNVVFNASGILNFAQGNMLVLGGLFAFLALPSQPDALHWWLSLPLVTAMLGVLLAAQGAITLLPLRSSVEQHSWLITTLAASVIVGAILLIYQGTAQQSVRSPFPSIRFLGTLVPAIYAICVALALLW